MRFLDGEWKLKSGLADAGELLGEVVAVYWVWVRTDDGERRRGVGSRDEGPKSSLRRSESNVLLASSAAQGGRRSAFLKPEVGGGLRGQGRTSLSVALGRTPLALVARTRSRRVGRRGRAREERVRGGEVEAIAARNEPAGDKGSQQLARSPELGRKRGRTCRRRASSWSGTSCRGQRRRRSRSQRRGCSRGSSTWSGWLPGWMALRQGCLGESCRAGPSRARGGRATWLGREVEGGGAVSRLDKDGWRGCRRRCRFE